MINAISVDLEDWFVVSNFKDMISRGEWNAWEKRLHIGTDKILRILDDHKTKATFFILGFSAERYPDIVRKVEQCGHEIASHGYNHKKVDEMNPEEAENDILKSVNVINSIVACKIAGYRAPSFSISSKTSWLFDILKRLGFEYDSSIFPTLFHHTDGYANVSLGPFVFDNKIKEFPLSMVRIGKYNIPCAGGGYFRLIPYPLLKIFIRKINGEGRPYIFYIHPWELDPDQPVINAPWIKKFRHYYNITNAGKKLDRLLCDFNFAPVKDVLEKYAK